MGFSREEYWSGLPFPPPGVPPLGVKPESPALQADSLPPELPGKSLNDLALLYFWEEELVHLYTSHRYSKEILDFQTNSHVSLLI